MPRDRFISDNLYNMRERFKRNHAEHQTVSDAPEADIIADKTTETPAEPEKKSFNTIDSVVSATTETPQKTVRLPQLAANSSSPENHRDIRELEGRLLRDLSFIDAENELIQQRSEAMKNFRNIAVDLLDELQKEGVSSRQLDLIRIKYFQAYGRFDAVVSQRGNASQTTLPDAGKSIPVWPVVSAVAGAALLISLTLIMLFGR